MGEEKVSVGQTFLSALECILTLPTPVSPREPRD